MTMRMMAKRATYKRRRQPVAKSSLASLVICLSVSLSWIPGLLSSSLAFAPPLSSSSSSTRYSSFGRRIQRPSSPPPPHHSSNDGRLFHASRESESQASSRTTNQEISRDDAEEEDEHDTVYYSPNTPLVERKDKDGRLLGDDKQGDAIDGPSSSTSVSSSSMNEYSFFDEAIIYVRAGSGGQGASSYKRMGRNGSQRGPPDGGNGGQGGNVILQVDASLNTLAGLSYTTYRPNAFGGSGAATSSTGGSSGISVRPKSFRAENGMDGASRFRTGRNGKDVVIRVPPGTVIQEIVVDKNSDGKEEETLIDMGTLTGPQQQQQQTFEQYRSTEKETTMIVAQGGLGGEGTGAFVKQGARGGSGGGGRRVSGSDARQSATGGERRRLKLTLQIVADVALVGVPNAGKSTFLAAVTRAKPKIANYPFTTVIPNLGVWIPPSQEQGQVASSSSPADDYDAGSSSDTGLVLCDVPGLIAGAADGVGLGQAFLRHVERCHVMVHLIDATSHDPIADYQMLNREIVRYNGTSSSTSTTTLANMPQVVVVNKMDVFDDKNEEKSADSETGTVQEDWEEGLQVRWSREELQEQLQSVMPHSRLLWMSAKEKTGVDQLMTRLAAFVQKVKQAKQEQEVEKK